MWQSSLESWLRVRRSSPANVRRCYITTDHCVLQKSREFIVERQETVKAEQNFTFQTPTFQVQEKQRQREISKVEEQNNNATDVT